MVDKVLKQKLQKDIMGRNHCSAIMPCGVCRVFNKSLDAYPKGYIGHYGKVIDI